MDNFPQGWRILKFGDITTMSQYGLSCSASDDGSIPMLRMNNIDGGTVKDSNLVYVSLSEKELKQYLLDPGDILFNRTNSYDLVGKTALFKSNEQYVCASYLVRFKIDSTQADPRYINQFFNSNESKKKLKSLATRGVSQSNINPTNLRKKFLILLPTLPEQRKIADLLTSWDQCIDKTQNLLDLKRKLKRGLMQQLLSGKKRFPEFGGQEWQRMRISEFTTHKPRLRSKPETPFTALGIRSHGKGTFLKPNFDPSKIDMTELFEVKENDLIVNITFGWEGAIAVAGSNDDGALVSHRFPTYTFKTEYAAPEFFRHIVVQKWFVEKLGLISPGGAGRNRVLNKKDFGKIEVLMPSVEEQRRIGSLLDACAKEIALLEQQLVMIKQQKRGLMQKLLTGQIRVKVGDGISEELINA